MATPHHLQISAENTGLLQYRQTEDVAAKVSELLQKNLEKHHVFVNEKGFHNIDHHLLALYGTGAGTGWLVQGYDRNASYQRPAQATHDSIVGELHDWQKAQQYLGNENYYSDFLAFFQREIDKLGWQDALNEYMFKGDARAEDMLQRMFAGFLHPIIQLMYGVEWEQPAIVAEALAEASVHKNRLQDFLVAAEKASLDVKGKMPPILDLMHEVAADPVLSKAAHWEDDNKIYDGVLARAADEAIRLCSKVRVNAEELEERTAEMFQMALYAAACAAIHPPKEPKFDFILMHHVNLAPFFVALNKQNWLTTENKVRILEWKIRVDLVQYAARGCPKLDFDAVVNYIPLDSSPVASPSELLPRLQATEDDGHVIKLARATLVCKQISKKFEDKPWAQFKGEQAWLNLMYLILDSVEGRKESSLWVRCAGFDEAWEDFPDEKPRPQKNGA